MVGPNRTYLICFGQRIFIGGFTGDSVVVERMLVAKMKNI